MKSLSQPAANHNQLPAQHESFDVQFQEHWTPIYLLTLRILGDPAESEDIALEAFYRLHQRPHIFRPDQNPRAWLYKVATNLALNALRADDRRHRYEDQLIEPRAAIENDPARIALRSETQLEVRAVLRQLRPHYARLLILRHSGLSYNEIATALKIRKGSVGSQLIRAERNFKQRYEALFPDTVK